MYKMTNGSDHEFWEQFSLNSWSVPAEDDVYGLFSVAINDVPILPQCPHAQVPANAPECPKCSVDGTAPAKVSRVKVAGASVTPLSMTLQEGRCLRARVANGSGCFCLQDGRRKGACDALTVAFP